MVAMLAFFFAFSTGGVAGMLLSTRRQLPRGLLVLLAVGSAAGFMLFALAMPFRGLLTELLVLVAGSLAFVGPARLFFTLAKAHQLQTTSAPPEPAASAWARPEVRRLISVVWLGLTMPTMPLILFTLASRFNHADALSWQFDGVITEKGRHTGNHNLPYLVIGGERRTRLEPVSERLWTQAREGQHLSKHAGSRTVFLDGVAFSILLNEEHWWNDSP